MGRDFRRPEPSGGDCQPDAAVRIETDPRGPGNLMEPPKDAKGSGTESGIQPQYGVPFGVTLNAFLSPFGLPCKQPAWGYISALDLKTNEVVWKNVSVRRRIACRSRCRSSCRLTRYADAGRPNLHRGQRAVYWRYRR